MKIHVPNFDGNKKSYKTFIRCLNLEFMANPHCYLGDQGKIFFTLSKMTKDFTLEWVNSYMERMVGGLVKNWAKF